MIAGKIRNSRNKADIALLCLAVIAGCCVLFFINSFGTPTVDEQYQSICVRRYREAPLAMLVFWIGNMWTSLFGFSIITLRNLLSIEELLLMGFSSWWLYRRVHNIRLTALIFLTGCVLLRSETFTIYNWDAGAYIFDTLALCLLISTINRPTSLRYWWLGAALALVGLARVPTAVFIPFAFLLIWKAGRTAGNARRPASSALFKMAGGMLIAFILVTTLMCGSPVEYLASFTSDNIITGHSPFSYSEHLISRFKDKVLELPTLWTPGIGCILIPIIAVRLRNIFRISLFIGWIVYTTVLLFFVRLSATSTHVLLGMGAPIAIGLVLAHPVYRLFKTSDKTDFRFKLSLWACALMIICINIGSDSYVERIVSGFALAPIVGVIWKFKDNSFKKYLKTTITLILVCYSTLALSYHACLIRRMPDTPVTAHPPYNGLKLTDDFLYEVEMAGEAVRKVRRQCIPYLYLGDRRIMELTIGADEGPGFNVFHRYPAVYNDWIEMKDSILNRIDAVVYVPETPYSDVPAVVEDIKASGFTEIEVCGGANILYRPKRLNPDKKYTDAFASSAY